MQCNQCLQFFNEGDGHFCHSIRGTSVATETIEIDGVLYPVIGSWITESPSVEVPSKPSPWPLLIRGIARRRIDSDQGVGDTVKRILTKVGGDQFEWVMKRLGIDCGCGSRQAWLNARYPYNKNYDQ